MRPALTVATLDNLFSPAGPLLLSMIEKIKAAGMNKPALGDAPLNLSAMLDNNADMESGEEASRSGEWPSGDVLETRND